MTGNHVAATLVNEERIFFHTHRHHIRAARVEMTTRGWIYRARDIAGQDDTFPAFFNNWVRDRHCREQRFGVRVQWVFVERIPIGEFHKFAQIHHDNAV